MPRLPISMPWSANTGKFSSSSSSSLVVKGVVVALLPVALSAAYVAYVLRRSAERTTAETSIVGLEEVFGWKSSGSSSPSSSSSSLKAKRGRRGRRRNAREKEEEEEENEGKGNEEEEKEKEKGEDDEERDIQSILPRAVLDAADEYVIARERVVSEVVPLARIRPSLRIFRAGEAEARGLLETYLGATMRCFAWTPQAFVMKALVKRLPGGGAALAETFSTAYLDACRFEGGETVCGVYVVRGRVWGADEGEKRGERVLLDLCAPEGWKGPVVCGVLDCGFVLENREGDEDEGEGKEGEGEEGEGERVVRFVNETVLWRRRDERPTLLEGRVSRWMHGMMVRWMMVQGVEAVTLGRERMKGKET
ncbi:hypothetical protein F5B17DRAFT_283646 [Nemania serpens]|nr:hypothetical protein F5B17DRAFT_283646 [Nemania serpens]